MSDPSEITSRTGEILSMHSGREGALLPILHDVQAAFGCIPSDSLAPIAKAMQISSAELHGVISFYHDFRRQPAGQHIVKLCRAEACQAMGAAELAEQAKATLGLDWHGTSADGAVTLEPVFCLGLCACGPAAMVDGQLIGRLDAPQLAALLAKLLPARSYGTGTGTQRDTAAIGGQEA